MIESRTTEADEPAVKLENHDGVALVTLNRPDRMNALNGPMTERYFSVMDACAADPAVRVIVVTGAGRGFCVGSDVEHLDAVLADPSTATISVGSRSFTDVTSVPKPVIAAINGACAGLGMVIAMSCDLRFAAAGAKLTTSFSRRGLVAEQGLSWLLPQVVGLSTSLDLLLSGRVVTAEEAATMGLVDRLSAPDRLLEEAMSYATDVATHCSPTSMARIKAQVWSSTRGTLAEAVDESRELVRQCISEADFAEGVASYVERRSPRFLPLA